MLKRAADDAVLVTNLSAATVRTDVTVSVPQVPEIWDPEKGWTDVAPVFRVGDDRVTVPMQLRPYEATLLVFRPGAHPVGQYAARHGQQCHRFRDGGGRRRVAGAGRRGPHRRRLRQRAVRREDVRGERHGQRPARRRSRSTVRGSSGSTGTAHRP